MDDPDVDHELIALLRESLGFSNKAQDGVSSNTGKAHIPLSNVFSTFDLMHYCTVKFVYRFHKFVGLRGVVAFSLTPF